jgi:hypothetical protein
MAGGLMQLVAYGAQDVYLTGNPKVTFFQAVYKRHTNFAMENIEQTVNGTAGDSGRLSVTVARNGDLVGDMFVELQAKTASLLTDNAMVAHRAISDVELSIGGQRVDKHYQRWWALYYNLWLSADERIAWSQMASCGSVSSTDKTVYLPLIFFFNRNPGLYLPLIALQYHEVRLDFDLTSEFTTATDGTTFKVWANYMFLDTEERRRFAQGSHEYLIEQVQHTGETTIGNNTQTNVRLTYNHPVKQLVWCFPKSDADATVAQFNFTNNNFTSIVNVSQSNLPVPFGTATFYAANNICSEEDNGPLKSFNLILNGQDRFKTQKGKYFNQVQAFNHCKGAGLPGVYSYSFALKPCEHQPTGTCNFSRIDNAQASIELKDMSKNTVLNMFAVNYNVLRVQSGMGGLAFSN